MKHMHKLYLPKNRPHPEQKKWIQLLAKFAELLDEYYNPRDPDVAYWYGEQCLTGLLATAAWSLRNQQGWALVELTASGRKKTKGVERSVDMWVGIDKNKNSEFTVEAKYYRPPGDPFNAVGSIYSKIKAARRYLRKLRKNHEIYCMDRTVAVCYIVPELSNLPAQEDINRIFKNSPDKLLRELQQELGGAHIVLGSFSYKENFPRDGRYFYPGLIVVGVIWRN